MSEEKGFRIPNCYGNRSKVADNRCRLIECIVTLQCEQLERQKNKRIEIIYRFACMGRTIDDNDAKKIQEVAEKTSFADPNHETPDYIIDRIIKVISDSQDLNIPENLTELLAQNMKEQL